MGVALWSITRYYSAGVATKGAQGVLCVSTLSLLFSKVKSRKIIIIVYQHLIRFQVSDKKKKKKKKKKMTTTTNNINSHKINRLKFKRHNWKSIHVCVLYILYRKRDQLNISKLLRDHYVLLSCIDF